MPQLLPDPDALPPDAPPGDTPETRASGRTSARASMRLRASGSMRTAFLKAEPWWRRVNPFFPAAILGAAACVACVIVARNVEAQRLRGLVTILQVDVDAHLTDARRHADHGRPDAALADVDAALAALADARDVARAWPDVVGGLDTAARVMRGELLLRRALPRGSTPPPASRIADLRAAESEFAQAVLGAGQYYKAGQWATTAWHGLGRARLHLGEWADADAAYDRLLALNPYHADGYAGRARVRRALGRLPEARADERRAESLGERQNEIRD